MISTEATSRVTTMLTRFIEKDEADLKIMQGRLADDMTKGYALDTHLVEIIFNLEQQVRNWQAIRTILKGEHGELSTALNRWLTDAVEQLMRPGRSGSTSLVRTAQMHSEDDGMKRVVRQVQQVTRYLAQ